MSCSTKKATVRVIDNGFLFWKDANSNYTEDTNNVGAGIMRN